MSYKHYKTGIEADWEDVGPSHVRCSTGGAGVAHDISMQDRIVCVTADEKDLEHFWAVPFSRDRHTALSNFYREELASLEQAPYETYDQESRIDYRLLHNHLARCIRREELEAQRDSAAQPLLAFAPPLVALCEARQACQFQHLDPQAIAAAMHDATQLVSKTWSSVDSGKVVVSKEAAYRALKNINALRQRLSEFHEFLQGYVPLYDWWAKAPYETLVKSMQSLGPIIATRLAGMRPSDKDEIIGEPIGRDALLVELDAEMIPYTPEELLKIAHERYTWCDKEMRKAASELGFGSDWKAALRHVQNIYVEPGQQPQLVKSLVDSGAAYVKRNDLVTVPPLAEQTWRMFMMSPAAQKVNPFFLGGPSIIVSYPTADMAHEDKLMSMRGNGPHLSKATAFHEMIPGHHLQLFVGERSRPYRQLFDTPFFVEGWAMYWELVFWDRGDFFTSAEDRVGTLFWRMHRCARILFSLKFHLGQLTPQQCVDLLVNMVGHERATAEGEVRRSLNGDYSPLYQAGYFLGAMQLYALREEVLRKGVYREKEFHDRVLRANVMPIELLRALILNEDVEREYKTKWRFYDEVSGPDVKKQRATVVSN